MTKAISSDNILLRNISDNKFLRRFGDIYLTVRRKKLGDALEKMTAVLRGGDKTDETFLQLYLNIASVLEKPDEFLYGKLCSAKYHLQRGKYDECRADINDLSEMGVEDNEDILRIKNKLEKLGK